MYEKAQPEIERIVALVALCPDKLQEKCFEILLVGYVTSVTTPALTSSAPPKPDPAQAQAKQTPAYSEAPAIPEQIKPKLVSLAGRNKVPLEKAAALFDFNTDPFTFHAYVAPGDNNAEKLRNVGLALSLKNYLTTGTWTADWQEFRAACIDQNCFDKGNAGTNMTKSGLFKSNSQADGIALSSKGVAAAEALFVSLTGPASE